MTPLVNEDDTPLAASAPAPQPAGGLAPVREVTLSTFVAEVIEASKQRLVIVDFWAPWCGPCKQLGPILEKLVREQKGAVILAKVDIDANPQIAQQMRVQSIPAVFAFSQGQPIDGFMGALPESQVKSWIERLVKATGSVPPGETGYGYGKALQQAAEALTAGHVDLAQAIYADILKEDPNNAEAFAGALRCLIALGDADGADEILSKAPPTLAKDKALESVRAAMDLAKQAQSASGELDALRAKSEANPNDHQARFDLAMAHYAAGQREQAVDALLDIVRRDRKWNDDGARKQLVKFFDAFGPTDPLTVASRKRLSSVLFS